jgi:hypothetical protein
VSLQEGLTKTIHYFEDLLRASPRPSAEPHPARAIPIRDTTYGGTSAPLGEPATGPA